MLALRHNVTLSELDVNIIENLFSLSPQQFVEVVSDIIDDFSNVQELISSIVTSFIDFDKYQIEGNKGQYKLASGEVLNLIDFVSATTYVVEKIVQKSVRCKQAKVS